MPLGEPMARRHRRGYTRETAIPAQARLLQCLLGAGRLHEERPSRPPETADSEDKSENRYGASEGNQKPQRGLRRESGDEEEDDQAAENPTDGEDRPSLVWLR